MRTMMMAMAAMTTHGRNERTRKVGSETQIILLIFQPSGEANWTPFLCLPATTRLVPMNESMIVAYRIPESAIVRDAILHINVASPSMNAPK